MFVSETRLKSDLKAKSPCKRFAPMRACWGDAGWNLDVSAHSDGISIDTDGITIRFVKTSDKKETITAEQEFLFNADVALDMMRQDKAERRRAQS